MDLGWHYIIKHKHTWKVEFYEIKRRKICWLLILYKRLSKYYGVNYACVWHVNKYYVVFHFNIYNMVVLFFVYIKFSSRKVFFKNKHFVYFIFQFFLLDFLFHLILFCFKEQKVMRRMSFSFLISLKFCRMFKMYKINIFFVLNENAIIRKICWLNFLMLLGFYRIEFLKFWIKVLILLNFKVAITIKSIPVFQDD